MFKDLNIKLLLLGGENGHKNANAYEHNLRLNFKDKYFNKATRSGFS